MSIAISSFRPANAQTPNAVVGGKVFDPSGGAIVSAGVTASAGGRHATTTSTDANGEFSISLPSADYTFTVSAEGFADEIRTLSLIDGVSHRLDVILQAAAQRTTITVTEAANYQVVATNTATKTATPLIDVPQSITIVAQDLIRDQMMMSIGDVVRYVPGITAIQGENNRDQVVIRGNSSSADFYVNGARDDVQYYRDLYNIEQVEALKGSNAMIFGRGGGGGVINRVTKEAGFASLREVTLQGGSFGNKRFSADFDHPFSDRAAFRLNGVYEDSGSFRKLVNLERYGVNPTLSFVPTRRTKITLGYEYFHDGRTADRGIPSFQGRPADVAISTFFGDPDNSRVTAGVHFGTAAIEHQLGGLNIRNRTLAADYDRFYQNYVPGAVNAGMTLVALSTYNNATRRRNVFNQTDLTYSATTGGIRHTLLWGAEAGRQHTNNFRNTGYFNNTATSILAPYANPAISAPITFRQSPTDADNRIEVNVAATYVQDQIEVSRFVQVVAGLRFDRFDLQYHNKRSNEDLRRIDNLASPRAGVIFKPAAGVSIYGNYSVAWLPSSGDQFASLTTVTQQVKPEKFNNYELGAKWDIRRYLSLTTALYRLDRTNTRATDPNDPARIVQTGSQRTNGYELGINGNIMRKWRAAGGYSCQDAFIASATAVARAGAQVPQAPRHTFSLWNSYQVLPRLSAGLGVLNRTGMFAAIDNTVVLPGYARIDAAMFYSLTETMRLQVNVENVANRQYYINADGNNNISPGSPRAIRVGLIARF